MRNLVLISDIHLYPENEVHPGRENFYVFLQHLIDQTVPGDLWILGDLFDFWFEYPKFIPDDYPELFALFQKLNSTGWIVNVLRGNHDFGMNGKFEEVTGAKILTGRTVEIDHNGTRILLTHGDGQGSGDIGYKLIRPILRSSVSAFLFRLLPRKFAFTFARSFSDTSKRILREECDLIPNGLGKWAAKQLAGSIDIVVTGHTHVACLEESENGIFVSLGDWLTKWTYCIIDGETGKPALLTFK